MWKYKARTELAGVKICAYAQNYMQTSFFAYKYAICMTQICICPNAGEKWEGRKWSEMGTEARTYVLQFGF